MLLLSSLLSSLPSLVVVLLLLCDAGKASEGNMLSLKVHSAQVGCAHRWWAVA